MPLTAASGAPHPDPTHEWQHQKTFTSSRNWHTVQGFGSSVKFRELDMNRHFLPPETLCPGFLTPTSLLVYATSLNNSRRKQINSGTARLPHHPKLEAQLLPPQFSIQFSIFHCGYDRPLKKKKKVKQKRNCLLLWPALPLR